MTPREALEQLNKRVDDGMPEWWSISAEYQDYYALLLTAIAKAELYDELMEDPGRDYITDPVK